MPNKKPSGSNALLWSITIMSLVLSILSLGRSFLFESPRVAAIDAVKLIAEYKGMDDVKRTQQQRNQQLRANLDTLRREFQTSLDQYQKSKNISNKKQLSQIEEELKVRQRNLITYEQSINDQIKKQDEELANSLLLKVNDYVKRYGEKNGYTVILASTQFGNIAYAKENIDITKEILEGLNKEYADIKR